MLLEAFRGLEAFKGCKELATALPDTMIHLHSLKIIN